MFNQKGRWRLTIALCMALGFSLVWAGTVGAQGETPEPPSAGDAAALVPALTPAPPEVTPVDEGTGQAPLAGDEPLSPPPPEATPAGENDGISSQAGMDGSDDPTTLPPPPPPPPDLSGVTSGLAATGVVLVDEEDHPLPVISQSVTDGAFPWIRVGTAIHYFATDCTGLTGNCHQGPNPVQGAVNYIVSSGILPTDRAIHIDSSIDVYKEDVRIDGAGNAILKQLNRLEGGCNRGTGLCDTGDPTQTIIEGKLEVIGTLAGFTLQGLTFKGGVTFTGNTGALTVRNVTIDGTGAASGGLSVTDQRGPVTLEGVSVVNSPGTGISIDNSVVIAPVNIVAGEVGNNAGSGGEINTRGSVTIAGSVFHHGGQGGLKITTTATLTVRNSLFLDNGIPDPATHPWDGTGLYATALAITLDGVQSSHNGRDGLMLNAIGGITIVNSKAEWNKRDGLRLCKDGDCSGTLGAGGAVNLSYDSFGGNVGYGAVVRNTGALNVISASFAWNGLDGLNVFSANPVTFNGIYASNNSQNGAVVDLCRYDDGLKRCTSGAGLTMIDIVGTNAFYSNTGDGLRVRSGGAVTLNGLDVSGNANGVVLANYETLAAPGVTLNRANINGNNLRGLILQTRGPVTWVKGGSSDNGSGLTPGSGLGGGAAIDNTFAAGLAPVSLIDVSFYNNQEGDGLRVTSKGAITLTRVNAGNNGAMGANLNNAGTGGLGGITIGGLFDQWRQFNGNHTYGLYVVSKGAILLSYLDLSNNGQQGAYVDNRTAPFFAPVTVLRISSNQNGDGGGVFVISRGAITVSDIDVGQNKGVGAWLENSDGAGPVTINRTIQGLNWFGNNRGIGLRIRARGQVTLNRIGANNVQPGSGYSGVGAWIDNCLFYDPDGDGPTAGKCLGAGGVNLFSLVGWNNDFHENASRGLYIVSGGAITVFNVQATRNGEAGVILDNNWDQPPFPVSVLSTGDVTMNIGGNADDGLAVYSSGAITIRNLQANDNHGYGAMLSNRRSLTAQPVYVYNSTFNNNSNGDGLRILSKGAVSLVGIEAQNNDLHETILPEAYYIDNRLRSTGINNADIFTFAQDTKEHTFTLNFDFNATLRLERWNAGASEWVLVEEVSGANELTITETFLADIDYRLLVIGNNLDNGSNYRLVHNNAVAPLRLGGGLYVNTYYATTYAPVTVSAVLPNNSVFSGNSTDGIVIYARGPVTLYRVAAEWNGASGAYVDNCLYDSASGRCTMTANLTVSGAANGFNGNKVDGVRFYSTGAINLDNFDAWGNGEHGAYLDNARGTAAVTLVSTNPNWTNNLSNNGMKGLEIYSGGSIMVSDSMVIQNRALGAYLNNTYGVGSVTIIASSFNGNQGFSSWDGTGLEIHTRGAVSMSGVDASENQGGGAYIENRTAVGVLPVTITKSGFNHNVGATTGSGLVIFSKGAITLNAVNANINTMSGIKLDNCLAASPGGPCTANAAITMLGAAGENFFYQNGEDGVYAISNAVIAFTRIRSGDNGQNHVKAGNGAYLESRAGSINVIDGLFERNWLNGLEAHALSGDINVTGIRCYSNAFDVSSPDLDTLAGAVLEAGKNVRVINSHFNGNAEYGLRYHKGAAFAFVWIVSTATGNNYEGVGAKNMQAF